MGHCGAQATKNFKVQKVLNSRGEYTYTKLAPNSKRDERKARGADGADGRNSDEEAEVSTAR